MVHDTFSAIKYPSELDTKLSDTTLEIVRKSPLKSPMDALTQQLIKQFKASLYIKSRKVKLSEEYKYIVTDEELAESLRITVVQMKILLEKGEVAKKVLIRTNMRGVYDLATYLRSKGINVAYSDLVQSGIFGLTKAVEEYDSRKGFRFLTHSLWWIKQSILRFVAGKSNKSNVKAYINERMVSSFNTAVVDFMQTHSKKPLSFEELATAHTALPGMGLESFSESESNYEASVRVHKPHTINADVYTNNRIQYPYDGDHNDSEREPSTIYAKNYIQSQLRSALTNLGEKEALIIEMRFGLLDGKPMTLQSIGKTLNLSRERIRQIIEKALPKIKGPIATSLHDADIPTYTTDVTLHVGDFIY